MEPLSWTKIESGVFGNNEGRYTIHGIEKGTWNYEPNKPVPYVGWFIWDTEENTMVSDDLYFSTIAQAKAEVERIRNQL